MTDQVLIILAEYGLPGLVIGYLAYQNNTKDKRIDTLTTMLVTKTAEDVERFSTITMTMERILMAVREGKF